MGLPKKKNTQFYRVPGYKVYYNLLKKLDMDAFAALLSQWLQDHTGSLPAALAMDGKMIRDTDGIVCLADHETGVPQAMAAMDNSVEVIDPNGNVVQAMNGSKLDVSRGIMQIIQKQLISEGFQSEDLT